MQTKNLAVEYKNISQDKLELLAEVLFALTNGIKVWLFVGDMGAGKTTFIKVLCKHLGVKESMSSPTFSIINEYQTENKELVYHFDFYRIKDEREAIDIGAEEYFYSGNYCFIEWPEKIPNVLPEQFALIKIETIDSNHRNIYLSTHGREEERI